MNRLATRIFFVLLLACVANVPAARAQNLLFDYVGFDYEYPDLNPAVFGAIGDGYQGLGEVTSLFSPLSADTSLYQYTYHFDGLVATSVNPVGQFVVISYANTGTITIYQDLKVGGTPADYGTNPPVLGVTPDTFTDGTKILIGNLTSFQYVLNTATNTGSFEADFKVVGGTQLGNFLPNQVDGWTFAGTSGNSVTIPIGYDHQVDGQAFLNPPTPTRTGSWGGIKARYR